MDRLMTREEYKRAIKKSRLKYGNEKTDGYESKFEATVAGKLQEYQRAGAITDLQYQQKYQIEILDKYGEFATIGSRYIRIDFKFSLKGKTILLDAKGCKDKYQMLKYDIFKFYLPDQYPNHVFRLLYYRNGWEEELTELILG